MHYMSPARHRLMTDSDSDTDTRTTAELLRFVANLVHLLVLHISVASRRDDLRISTLTGVVDADIWPTYNLVWTILRVWFFSCGIHRDLKHGNSSRKALNDRNIRYLDVL
jgi:hypothetical protein